LLNERVAIHFAHRVGALVVTLVVLALVTLIFSAARRHSRLVNGALGLIAAVAMQIALGAQVIWSARDPVITSLHVVNGAAVLAIALLLAMRATKLKALLQPEANHWKPAGYQEVHA
jgi:cytochrome c oxidase assembly protein subunit 15